MHAKSTHTGFQFFRLLIIAGILLAIGIQPGCSQDQQAKQQTMQSSRWHAELALPDEPLPFEFSIDSDGQWVIFNGTEEIPAEVEVTEGGSVARLPVFDSEIRFAEKDGSMEGEWHNLAKGDYSIPFKATTNSTGRFLPTGETALQDPSGNWEVYFIDGEEREEALGRFELKEGRLLGTFLTPTGDYRFLEGTVNGNTLWLSCFDGAHAFLFKAEISADGNEMKGTFWSGKHWKQDWVASRNENYTLPDPDSLTFLKDGYERMAFEFPDLEGNMVSLEDERFQDKVVLVQIMGSWCPNCKDEMEFYNEVYPQYADKGFEIITLAFEAGSDPEGWKADAARLQRYYDLPWPILLAGKASKKEAAEKLPMLNHVMSFPTSIFIDKTGKVQRIHTGFAGPATGGEYDKFVEDFHKTIVSLLEA